MATPEVLGEYEFIIIVLRGMTPSGKTAIFDVRSKRGEDLLGTIRWFARWRQYAFYPASLTIYSAGCLDDIADFLRVAKRKVR